MHKYITDQKSFGYGEFFKHLQQQPLAGIDVEATSLDVFKATWLLLQIQLGEDTYIFDARNLGQKFMTYIISLLRSSGILVLGHNISYDLKIIYLNTGVLLTRVYDSMLMESFLNKGKSSGKVFYSLSELVAVYAEEFLDKDIRQTFIDQTGPITEEQLEYSAKDVQFLKKIYDAHMKKIQENKLEKIYELEMNLVPVIVDMELAGVYLDSDAWKQLEVNAYSEREESRKSLLDLIAKSIDFSLFENGYQLALAFHIPVKSKKARLELESMVGVDILSEWLKASLNLNSHVQLLTLLKTIFKLEIESTDENELLDNDDGVIVPKLLEYRGFNKRITTYGSEFLSKINPSTGRIHPEFLQQGTVSGRLSANSPNPQNIPADKRYRNAFKAQYSDTSIISWDYSQQEYRLAGAIPMDPVIIDAYKQGKDMHTATASLVFNKPLEEITKEERSLGKTINFAVLYGSSAWGLAFKMKIKPDRAEELLSIFHAGYPILSSFKEFFENEVWRMKFSSTLLGRKRYFDVPFFFRDYKEAGKIESKVKREGFNHLIQGTGADVTKLAMIKMHNENPFGGKFKLILQIHDEIVAEVHDSIKEAADEFGKKCMLDVFQPFLGEIPAAVESHIDKCWNK